MSNEVDNRILQYINEYYEGKDSFNSEALFEMIEEAMAEAAPARILAGGERTALPPALCVARSYEAAHPRPDLDEFIEQYRKAGGQIDVNIFEGEGPGLLSDLSSPIAKETLDLMSAFIHQHLG